jgi:hypothetical protein
MLMEMVDVLHNVILLDMVARVVLVRKQRLVNVEILELP